MVAAILAGKPIGISAGGFVSAGWLGLQLPRDVTWRDMIVVGVIAGIGFTVALFFATAAFPPGPLLDQTKMGALLSLAASVAAIGLAAVLRVGRYGSRVQRPAS